MSDSATMESGLSFEHARFALGTAAVVLVGITFVAAVGDMPTLVAAALLIGLAAVAVAAVVRPTLVLITFVALLPIHLLLMVLFFNAGMDHGLLRAFSVWKELAALVALAVLAARFIAGGKVPRLHVLDVIVLIFLAWNLLYLVAPIGSAFRAPMMLRAQGLRDNVFFVFLYFIGRLAPMSVRDVRLALASMIGVGVLGVLVGLLERFLVPIGFFFDPLNLDGFMREYLNLHYHTGLPFNFWTSVGNVRRAVSFYLGSHHFAASFLLLIPLVLGLRRPLRAFPHGTRMVLLCIAAIGLALPLTRSVMLACFLQILLLGLIDRRPHWVLSAATAAFLMLGASLVFLDLGDYFTRVATAAPGSSVYTHAESWRDTLGVVGEYPMGVGFGVLDTAAERGGDTGTGRTPEGEYAFTATTVGLPGLLLLLALQASAVGTVWLRWARPPGPALRNLALVTLAMVAGYVVMGSFTQVRHVPALMYPLWWLVGTVTSGALTGDCAPRHTAPSSPPPG